MITMRLKTRNTAPDDDGDVDGEARVASKSAGCSFTPFCVCARGSGGAG